MAEVMTDAEFHQIVGRHNIQCQGMSFSSTKEAERLIKGLIDDRTRLLLEVARLRGLPAGRGQR